MTWSVSIFLSVLLLTAPPPAGEPPANEVFIVVTFSIIVIKFLYTRQLDAFASSRQKLDSRQVIWRIIAWQFILGTLLGMPIFAFILFYFFTGEFDSKALPIYFLLFNLPALISLIILNLNRKR